MTTAEVITCKILNCGINDIEYMFDKMTETGLFHDAYNELIDNDCHATANSIWAEGIRIAIKQIFGEEYLEDFEINANCSDSSVTFLGDGDSIIDYDEKVERFYNQTGFDPTR